LQDNLFVNIKNITRNAKEKEEREGLPFSWEWQRGVREWENWNRDCRAPCGCSQSEI